MKATAIAILGAIYLAFSTLVPAGASTESGKAFLAKVLTVWNGIKTYQCTISAHEAKGSATQDRIYHFYFSKPYDTRAEIVAGDSRGSVGVWRGGNSVRGHQGGLLRGIMMNVGLHSRLATTLRGTTFAESNMGAILLHLKSLPPQALKLSRAGKTSVITASLPDPPKSDGVTKEIYYFGENRLPVRYEQYEGSVLVKRVVYSDLKLNPSFPRALFNL